jgi:ubiquitin C-terminal hydrolase
MGVCCSIPHKDAVTRLHHPPLPPPAQDLVNQLLNRWRYGEVATLQRVYRKARDEQDSSSPARPQRDSWRFVRSADARDKDAAPAAVAKSKEKEAQELLLQNLPDGGGDDQSSTSSLFIPLSPTTDGIGSSHPIAVEGELNLSHSTSVVSSNPAAAAVPATASATVLVAQGNGGPKPPRHLSLDGFLKAFPSLVPLPAEIRANAFSCFDSHGKGAIDFRDFARALSLCCRGSRSERLRFLLDLFSETTPKYRGNGGDDTLELAADMVVLSAERASSLMLFCNPDRAFPVDQDMTASQFSEWADAELSQQALDSALRPFYLLPSPEQERERAKEILLCCPLEAPGDVLFLLSMTWWTQWVRAVSFSSVAKELGSRARRLGLEGHSRSRTSSDPSQYASGLHRPHEIDNSALQGSMEWQLREGLRESVDFVALPAALWHALLEWYGGGPAFPRRVCLASKSEVLLDPYPVGFSINLCTVSGHPGPRERLVLCSRHATLEEFLSYVLSDFGVSPCDAKGKKTAARLWIRSSIPVPVLGSVTRSSLLSPNARPNAAGLMGGGSGRPATTVESWQLLQDDGQRRVEELAVESGNHKLMLEVKQPPPRFQDISEEGEGGEGEGHKPDQPDIAPPGTSDTCEEPVWPRNKFIEPEKFRNFRVKDELDAMDYQGRWYKATVMGVEVVRIKVTSGQQCALMEGPVGRLEKLPGVVGDASKGKVPIKVHFFDSEDASASRESAKPKTATVEKRAIRVHFDRFADQWDEVYDATSMRLAPAASFTAPVPPSHKKSLLRTESSNDMSGTSPPAAEVGGNSARPAQVQSGSSPPTAKSEGPSNNYSEVRLSRKANTPGKPPFPGACGLVNLGNSCYMNGAVQCLSHTPLLRAYLLSDMYVPELNRGNTLGTGGKLMEEFAALLKTLWSGEYLCVHPSRFKRGLGKWKTHYAGNEQQDSQELLAELLDGLHEDVNRVLDKPYVPAPEDEEERLSEIVRANEAWDRHLMRNRSVFVDLFQGQLKMTVQCASCGKQSVNFDPFMYLSVPIPIRGEKAVVVFLLRRISTATSGTTDGSTEAGAHFAPPERFGMMLPRLGEVSEIKARLSEMCGIDGSLLSIVDLFKSQMHRIFTGQERLTSLRDDDTIVAYELSSPPIRDPAAGKAGAELDPNLDPDDAEGNAFYNSNNWPASLADVPRFWRLDALDTQSNWCSGMVEEVSRSKAPRVRVHFDGYASNWDEWYGEEAWRDGKLAPLGSKVERRKKRAEIIVVHRKLSEPRFPSASTANGGSAAAASMESFLSIFGFPLLLYCDQTRSVRHLWRSIVQQSARFIADPAVAAIAAAISLPDSEITDKLPFTVRICSTQNPLSKGGSRDLNPTSKQHVASVITPKTLVVLDWRDPRITYLDPLVSSVDHESCEALEEMAQQMNEGLPLSKCLESYTRDEAMDDESYYCGRCKMHRDASYRIQLWKMPDMLVIHVKRFHHTARWHEKIRSLVIYPVSGMDMSPFMAEASPHGASAGNGGLVYDLYGILNHMGGMTGGHYTACCRSTPCSGNGVEEVGHWGMEHPWLHFDDEFIEEIAPNKVVSESAYVLFYRRRRLSASNVVNCTA